MSEDLFALLSLAARYWFCGLMLVIVFRAWRLTGLQARRAREIRARTPGGGCVGEFVVNPGKGKRRASLPIPREGVLGRSRRADVSIRDKSLKRYHALLEKREGGLLVRPYAKAKASLNGKFTGEALILRDGDTLVVGDLRLLYVAFEPEAVDPAPEKTNPKHTEKEKADDLRAFEDELWQDP